MLTSAKKIMFSFEALISVPEGLRFPKVSDETFRNFPFSDPNSTSGKKTYFFSDPKSTPGKKNSFFSTFV